MSGKFLKVKCKCGSEQTMFSHATSLVNCNGCKAPLSHATGATAAIVGEVVEELK
ncbi:30S ribosomal protein S27e [Candidatus Micrarchaeota archaeon]|nr:30S ribosomal protein S27e [Candidatus Micrarchaeota archaeon]